MKIGIIGARIAGSYAALLLARMGHEVVMFDYSTEAEKPCGGGVTPKALGRIGWLRENRLPHSEIHFLRLIAHDGHTVEMRLGHPIFIFSRSVLDTALRRSAVDAGARFLPERACGFAHQRKGWGVKTTNGDHEFDFLIGADGAASSVRAATAGKFAAGDLSLAMGFYLPGRHHTDTIVISFQESGFLGYLWSLPRMDHSSVGILRWLPTARSADLKERLGAFISTRYPGHSNGMRFYAARIPCLSLRSLATQHVCGPDWALVGDAAGFADPITAEGIYFAFRSAEMLAQAIVRRDPESYEHAWRDDFGFEFQRAAAWRDRFYAGTFLLQAFTSRAVRMVGRSGTIRRITDGMIAGRGSYLRLRRQLVANTPRILVEAILSRIHENSKPEPQDQHHWDGEDAADFRT